MYIELSGQRNLQSLASSAERDKPLDRKGEGGNDYDNERKR